MSQRSIRIRRWGFLVWIISNSFLISWAMLAVQWPLFGMYVIYSITSLMGWWNNRAPSTQALPLPMDDREPAIGSVSACTDDDG